MRPFSVVSLLVATTAAKKAIPSLWDSQCFYPQGDPGFELDSYLGRWYQVAGTIAPFTADCKCIFAEYELNDNGTVQVNNTCQAGNKPVSILGTATPADPEYGPAGVFRVQFPRGGPPDCPGPNYIVQDYSVEFALVQSNNFTTLFILSRQQHPEEKLIDAWIERAGLLGTNLTDVVKTDQSDCLFI
jgi:apolipoprotein D and lipocalin family protein